MPFDLKNAPVVFQNFINDVFEDVIGKYGFCYIDDIIFSPYLETHYKHLAEVLTRLRNTCLYSKHEKYEFCVPFLDFAFPLMEFLWTLKRFHLF